MEKRKVKKGLKQKVKSAPKQIIRRGLDDGTERLRGHLRDAAQRGQANDYGGDRIEDTAVGGAQRTVRGAERGIEALLKKKKNGRDRVPQEEPRFTAEPPALQESPADPPLREPPRIKMREAVTAKEGGATSSEGGRSVDGKQQSNRRRSGARAMALFRRSRAAETRRLPLQRSVDMLRPIRFTGR